MPTAEAYIQQYGLLPHPEGGFYKEVYRSKELHRGQDLPARFGGDRHFLTSIYFLIKREYPSHFHRIKSDEIWYFHDGGPVVVHILHPHGAYEKISLGKTLSVNQQLQACVPAGSWFAAECAASNEQGFSLVSCAVAPGFDFADFEMAETLPLQLQYPEYHELIQRLS